MLVLSRKKDESLVIGDNIKITIVELSNDRARIGIDAPADIKIIRGELYDTEKFNIQAAVKRPETSAIQNMLKQFTIDNRQL